MKVINNVTETVRDDLSETIRKGSRLSIAAGCFSIYAYQELRKQLDFVEQVRFIFTSPTFVQEKAPKTKREFYIPRLSRERSLYGTEFEIKLRNELTQRAIAKECADWIRKKVTFKSNTTPDLMTGFLTVDESTYMPISGFTTVDLGCERGNNIYNIVTRTEEYENGRQFIRLFDEIWQDERKLQDVTDIVLESITTAYRENSPDFIYFYTLYNIFNEFLEDISEDGFLLACFDSGVTTETVTAIAKKKPYYAVFRDSSMANDSVATNFDQIFETYSPQTTRKVL